MEQAPASEVFLLGTLRAARINEGCNGVVNREGVFYYLISRILANAFMASFLFDFLNVCPSQNR